VTDRFDAVLHVRLHRARDLRRLLHDQLAVLLDPRPHGVDDRLVAFGQRLERGGDLPGDVGELGPERPGVPGHARPLARGDGVGELLPRLAHGIGEEVERVLQPRRPDRERLEPLVGVRDEAPDRLVPGELQEDLGTDLVLVAARGPPDLARDLVHERARGEPDRLQPLLEATLDPFLPSFDQLARVVLVRLDGRGEIRPVHMSLAFRGRREASG
jgi:hypothetical protein